MQQLRFSFVFMVKSVRQLKKEYHEELRDIMIIILCLV